MKQSVVVIKLYFVWCSNSGLAGPPANWLSQPATSIVPPALSNLHAPTQLIASHLFF